MKKTMKKCLTLLLALAMLLAMAVPAVAEENYSQTITFTGVAKGDTVKAYRVMRYINDYNAYDYHPDFKKYVDATPNHAPNVSTEKYLSTLNSTETGIFLTGYVNQCLLTDENSPFHLTLPAEYATAKANEQKEATMNLEPGYYILLVSTTEQNNRTYKLTTVFVQVKNGESKVIATDGKTEIINGKVQLKHTDGPTVSMFVKDDSGAGGADWKSVAAGSVGEEMNFYIQVETPNYENDNIWMTQFTLNNTMHGLKYVENSAVLTTTAPYGGTDATEKASALKTTTIGDYENGSQQVTFDLDYHELNATGNGVSAFVHFKAIVMPEVAEAGEQATAGASLTYKFSLEPDKERTTDSSTVTVYNYAFSINKTTDDQINPEEESEGYKALSGAGFTLYTDDTLKTAVKMIKVTPEAGEKYYRPATADEITAGTGIVTEMNADMGDSHNVLLVRGLDVGNHYIKETKVPSGFYAPKSGFKVELNGERVAVELSGKLTATSHCAAMNEATDKPLVTSYSINATDNSRLDINLKNSSTPVLPTTGGVGTVMFTVIGLLCMGAALWFFLFARRRREDEQEQNKTTL